MISAGAWSEMAPAFSAGYPHEVCMAVWSDETFEVLENCHPTPELSFRLTDADAYRLTKAYEAGKLLAFLHSHPDGPAYPSDRDYKSQLGRGRGDGLGWTYGIVQVHGDGLGGVTAVMPPNLWGDAVDRGPLVGRTYLWGIRDCFALVRDYYKEQGIYVPDAPRIRDPSIYPVGQWERTFFATWIGKCGFESVERHLRKPGDAFTYRTQGGEPDHCGIYLGEGRYLHHATDKCSEVDQMRYEEEVLAHYNAEFWRLRKPIPLK